MSSDGFSRIDVVAPDGVRLAAYEWRPQAPADADAPVVFLANGLGGNLSTWRHQLRQLKARGYRVVAWDYRGLYGSTLDAEEAARVEVALPAHVDDAVAVLDALDVERAIFFGWSMGVQLNFELYRRVPERFAAMIQIAGSYGRALRTTRFGKLGEHLIPPLMAGWREAADRFGPTLGRALGSKPAIEVARRIGVVAPPVDRALAGELIDAYVRLDFGVYNQILLSLNDHDASEVLATIAVPTLILAGTRDPMTPHWLSHHMVETIPDAELSLIDGGSHYVPIEYPARVNDAVFAFLDRRVPRAGG